MIVIEGIVQKRDLIYRLKRGCGEVNLCFLKFYPNRLLGRSDKGESEKKNRERELLGDCDRKDQKDHQSA